MAQAKKMNFYKNAHLKLSELNTKNLLLLLLVTDACLVLAGFVGFTVITRVFGPFSCKAFRSVVFDKKVLLGKTCPFHHLKTMPNLSLASVYAVVVFYALLVPFGLYFNFLLVKHLLKNKKKTH
ncbi:conserved hypothetical protein [Theileria orientalis strain Shintoku]|uniref:Uncharacterized protein n=1 Tax=Theileria orientalis strain Shintoku TaxID=869250 RepID=J4DPC2_THEOR|nr:conserved hypothetical protein [Theileria orientalis strain Shintoku]PVC52150.1 hypothetical protein MACL_00001001 [Theileria orientalis]BAM40449.1 conserved hypothetical protein [Theileria orientalis strain Shintoku]|eukprot:XP_009690750.1 conserved hypothetical protein [Theileria orientalis strain Shintoku]